MHREERRSAARACAPRPSRKATMFVFCSPTVMGHSEAKEAGSNDCSRDGAPVFPTRFEISAEQDKHFRMKPLADSLHYRTAEE